jgi:hypothetical protein
MLRAFLFIFISVPDNGFVKKPKHVAYLEQYRILSENAIMIAVLLFICLFMHYKGIGDPKKYTHKNISFENVTYLIYSLMTSTN